jgi:hypothetical protein
MVLATLSATGLAPSGIEGLPTPARAAGPLRFGRSVVVVPATPGPQGAIQGEPRLLVGHGGELYLSAQFQPVDCATGRPDRGKARSCVWESTDEGTHWRAIGGEPGGQAGDDVDLAAPTRVPWCFPP